LLIISILDIFNKGINDNFNKKTSQQFI